MSDKSLPELFKQVASVVVAIVGFFTALVTFGDQVKKNPYGITLVIGVCILAVWLSAVYVYYKKAKPPRVAGPRTPPSRKYEFSDRLRNVARVTLWAVPTLSVCWFTTAWVISKLPSNKIVVLVADFDSVDKNLRLSKPIIAELQKAAKKFSELKIDSLGQVITVEQGDEYAEEVGRQRKASIVVWGWSASDEVTVYYHLTSGLVDSDLVEERPKFRVDSPQELDTATTRGNIASQVQNVTLVVAGLAKLKAKDYDGAIERLKDAAAKIPDQFVSRANILFYAGLASLAKGDKRNAIYLFEDCVRSNPDFYQAHINLGIAYNRVGDFDSALKSFSEALKRNNDPVAHINRGMTYIYKNELDDAFYEMQQALALDPNNADAHLNVGYILSKRGDVDGAIKHYQRAAELDPTDVTAVSNICNAYILKEDYSTALRFCNEALRIESDNFVALETRGLLYLRLQKADLALGEFNRSIENRPDNDTAYYYRGEAYLLEHDESRAIADFQKALAFTDDPELEGKIESKLVRMSDPAAERLVRRVDARRDEAFQKKDAEHLKQITADDFIASDYEYSFTKQDNLDLLRRGNNAWCEPSSLNVVMYRQSALMTGEGKYIEGPSDTPVARGCRFRRVYALRNGNWFIVAAKRAVLNN